MSAMFRAFLTSPTESEQPEETQIAIMGNPVNDGGHHVGSPPKIPVDGAQGCRALCG